MAERSHPDDLAQIRAELVAQRIEITRLKYRRRLPRQCPSFSLAH